MLKVDSILKFRKHKGRTIEEIWTGIIPIDENLVLQKYIEELCDFFLKNKELKAIIPASSFDLSLSSNELLFFTQNNIVPEIKVENNEIYINAADKNLCVAAFKVLSDILSKSFMNKSKFYSKNSGETIDYSTNSNHFRFLQAHPTYIDWCIENIENFCLYPAELEKLRTKLCRYFIRFELSKISETTYSYNPIFNELGHNQPDEVQRINNYKYSNRTNSGGNINPSFPDNNSGPDYCTSCHESPCMCSDREGSSSVYDF